MEFESFSCQRLLLENLTSTIQRNILVQIYCNEKFGFFNLVDFYFNSVNRNAILMFIFILIAIPLLFLCIAEVAEKYLVV